MFAQRRDLGSRYGCRMRRLRYSLVVVPLAAIMAFATLHLVSGHHAATPAADRRAAATSAAAAISAADRRAPATPVADRRAAATPAPDHRAATHPVTELASDGGPWRLVYSTDFPQDAPLGSFSGCVDSTKTCSGLPSALQSQWWAYGNGWPDSSTLRHERVHGYYSPSTTVWISGGMMNIRLWRGTGTVHSAALLPKAALNRTYGKYVETFRVTDPDPGYKSADMLHAASMRPADGSAHEIDFPEASWGTQFYAFVHFDTFQRAFPSGTAFNDAWTTTMIEWTPHGVSFYVNGREIGSVTGRVSDVPMKWILQNETQFNGQAVPAVNSSSTMQIKYVAYYSWVG
jgi:hypothetical protein